MSMFRTKSFVRTTVKGKAFNEPTERALTPIVVAVIGLAGALGGAVVTVYFGRPAYHPYVAAEGVKEPTSLFNGAKLRFINICNKGDVKIVLNYISPTDHYLREIEPKQCLPEDVKTVQVIPTSNPVSLTWAWLDQHQGSD